MQEYCNIINKIASAINAKKLEVVFSKEVVKTGQAETTTNYTVVNKATGAQVTVSTATLSANEKKVTLDLATALDGDYVVTVKPIQSKADTSKVSPLYTKDITFKDTVKPTVTGVTYPRAGVAEIQMSEEIDMTGATVTMTRTDGVAINPLTENVALHGTDKTKFIANVQANVEYKIVIVGAQDMAGNIITPNPVTVTVKSTIVDTVKPTVESMKSTGVDSLEIKFSEGLNVVGLNDWDKYATISVDGTPLVGGKQIFDADTNTLKVTGMLANLGVGIKSVKVSAHKDFAGNTGVDFTKNIQFAAAVAKLQSTTVKADNKEIKFTFDMPVTRTGTNPVVLTLVDKDMVTKKVTVATEDVSVDGKNFIIKNATGFAPGKYTGKITNADINELGTNDEVAIAFEVKAPVDTTKATPTVGVPTAQEVTVTYDKDMGTSALDVNNYKVSGNSVFKSAIFDGNARTVKLTFNPGTIVLDGNYEMTISSAVKTQAGVAIDAFAKVAKFLENVAPTVKKAELEGNNKININFSEKIAYSADPFEVYVDGIKVNIDTINQVLIGDKTDTAVITLTNPLTDLNKTITVKTKKAAVMVDTNGNKLVTEGTYTVTK